MHSKMGLLQGLEVAHLPSKEMDFGRLSPVDHATPPQSDPQTQDGNGHHTLASPWNADFSQKDFEYLPQGQGFAAVEGAVGLRHPVQVAPVPGLDASSVGASAGSPDDGDRPVKRGRY